MNLKRFQNQIDDVVVRAVRVGWATAELWELVRWHGLEKYSPRIALDLVGRALDPDVVHPFDPTDLLAFKTSSSLVLCRADALVAGDVWLVEAEDSDDVEEDDGDEEDPADHTNSDETDYE